MTDDRLAAPRAPVRVPARRDIVRFAVRSLVVWVGIRVAVAILLRFAGMLAESTELHPAGVMAVVAITALAVALDARRTRGYLFHANLGQHPAWPTLIAVGVGGVMELCVGLAMRVG